MPAPDPSFLTIPISHRGYHDRAAGRIENSPAAFRAAIEAGYGIELDVQMSSDRAAMVFHDPHLDRLTGESGDVNARTASALRVIVLTGGADRIHTLPEILSLVAGRVPLLIEIKDQDGAMGLNVGPLEEAVAEALAGYAGPVAVMSFNPHSVAAFGALMPDVPRGIVTMDYIAQPQPGVPDAYGRQLSELEDFDRVGASFVSCDRHDLDRPVIHALKARGVPVLTWTIKSEAQEAEARRIADNITFEDYAARMPA